MPEIRDSHNQFKETLLKTETRMLILSTCKKCGAAKLVSAYDGSRKEWQDNHKCKEAGQAIGNHSQDAAAPVLGREPAPSPL
jgi:hypothetical protein